MKRKITIKFLLLTVFMIGLFMGLAACSGNRRDNKQVEDLLGENQSSAIHTKVTDGFDYSLVNRNGKHYIIFDDISLYTGKSYENEMCIMEVACLTFTSMKDFKDSVTKGTLTYDQKRIIAKNFKKDDNGIVSCDFNNLYVPAVPEDAYVNAVYWSGDLSYTFGMRITDNVFGYLEYLSADAYTQSYMSEHENFFDRDTISVIESKHFQGNKTVTNYSTRFSENMIVSYTLYDGNRTIIVDKEYCLYASDPLIDFVSSSVPHQVTLYCTEGSMHYIVTLHKFTEDPDDDWLLKFGVAPYVENGIADK